MSKKKHSLNDLIIHHDLKKAHQMTVLPVRGLHHLAHYTVWVKLDVGLLVVDCP